MQVEREKRYHYPTTTIIIIIIILMHHASLLVHHASRLPPPPLLYLNMSHMCRMMQWREGPSIINGMKKTLIVFHQLFHLFDQAFLCSPVDTYQHGGDGGGGDDGDANWADLEREEEEGNSHHHYHQQVMFGSIYLIFSSFILHVL